MTATRDEIVALLREGHSNSSIMRALRCDKARVRRIREELGLPAFVPVEQTRTIEEKWALFAKPIEGGHMEWTGPRASAASRTPVLSYKDKVYTAAAIAFRIQHGRQPQGYVKAECGVEQCVAPGCVDDEAGRLRTREQFRYLTGGQKRKETCVHGHDQAVHGGYGSNGIAYCKKCKALAKHPEQTAVTA